MYGVGEERLFRVFSCVDRKDEGTELILFAELCLNVLVIADSCLVIVLLNSSEQSSQQSCFFIVPGWPPQGVFQSDLHRSTQISQG